MSKPKVVVLSGYGLNCEEETLHAFKAGGAEGDIVHINDLIDKPGKLRQYKVMAVPGGFSYGDDTGSGKAYANRLKNHLWTELQKFVESDKLVIGLCNGFQVLTSLGLLPGALTFNNSARYVDRWVDIKVTSESPWLQNIESLSLPIAHGEGRFYADPKTIKSLKNDNAIAVKYFKGDVSREHNLEPNPNGSADDIAGVTAYGGRVLGMMPHPERALFTIQHPDFFKVKEEAKRNGKKMREHGPALQIFKNSVNYFS